MTSVLRQMSDVHYVQYIEHFNTVTDLMDFLMEILMTFKDLVSNNVYPPDWNDMIMLQNRSVGPTQFGSMVDCKISRGNVSPF